MKRNSAGKDEAVKRKSAAQGDAGSRNRHAGIQRGGLPPTLTSGMHGIKDASAGSAQR